MPARDPSSAPAASASPVRAGLATRLPLWLRACVTRPAVESPPDDAPAPEADEFVHELRSLQLTPRPRARSEAPAKPRESVRVPPNPTLPPPPSIPLRPPVPSVPPPPAAPRGNADQVARLEERVAALEARLDAERAGAAAVLALAKRLASLQTPLEAAARSHGTVPPALEAGAAARTAPPSIAPGRESTAPAPAPESAVHAAWPEVSPASSSWGLAAEAHPPVAPLLAVRGIGPAYARLLTRAGIDDAVALAALDDEQLHALTSRLRAAPRRAQAWRDAARELLAG